jgi:hypothetical protein
VKHALKVFLNPFFGVDRGSYITCPHSITGRKKWQKFEGEVKLGFFGGLPPWNYLDAHPKACS